MSEVSELISEFERWFSEDKTLSMAVAAVKALTHVTKKSNALTMQELTKELDNTSQLLLNATNKSISLMAGCELFTRLVTRAALDHSDFEGFKKVIIEGGENLISKSVELKAQVAKYASQFITDGAVVLIHSYSRVVTAALLEASSQQKRFQVYVTESRATRSGYESIKALSQANIPVTLIHDSAVGYIIDKVDLVIVGAEGVVENGGIINQIGTYQMAIVAKAANKPFYVAVESYKFVRMYPLNQYDISFGSTSNISLSLKSSKFEHDPLPPGAQVLNQTIDYTPPVYITLLFTDLGVLTPSAVSDELIKLYF